MHRHGNHDISRLLLLFGKAFLLIAKQQDRCPRAQATKVEKEEETSVFQKIASMLARTAAWMIGIHAAVQYERRRSATAPRLSLIAAGRIHLSTAEAPTPAPSPA